MYISFRNREDDSEVKIVILFGVFFLIAWNGLNLICESEKEKWDWYRNFR